jgi:hypothetical protein
MTSAREGGAGSASRPGRSLPLVKTWYPLYRRLGGPQGRSGQVQKISPPWGFDPRTVQPIANRYTDYANRPTTWSQTIRQSLKPLISLSLSGLYDFLTPLIIKAPSLVFYAIMTIGSVEVIHIQVKTGKKTEASLVTATANRKWRSHSTVMT